LVRVQRREQPRTAGAEYQYVSFYFSHLNSLTAKDGRVEEEAC
jgi:hypothetical protein